MTASRGPVPSHTTNTVPSLPLIVGDEVFDMAEVKNLLITGSSNSGKTTLVRGMLADLATSRDPGGVFVTIAAPATRRYEYSAFTDLPHVAELTENTEWLLESARMLMIERANSQVNYPSVLIVLDDPTITDGVKLNPLLHQLLSSGPTVGIHIVMATGHPSVYGITSVCPGPQILTTVRSVRPSQEVWGAPVSPHDVDSYAVNSAVEMATKLAAGIAS